MNHDAPPPRRVRVTSPRMGAARRPPARPAAREIDEETGVGEVYMRSLIRAQLRLGLTVLAAFVLPVAAVPMLFALVPSVATVQVLGLPLPWLLLGAGVYPVVLLGAWLYVRASERAERDFVDLVDHT